MPVSAQTLRLLMEAGLQGDALLAVVESIDADMSSHEKTRSSAAIRQQRYRERKKSQAESVTGDVTRDVTRDVTQKENTPTPPKEKQMPPSPPKGGSSPKLGVEFEEFWNLYPNKVGKRKADEAFRKARKRAEFEEIMAGLRRYVAKTDDRPWCNPATWLNQDRWTDDPATSPQAQPPLIEDGERWQKRLLWAREKRQWATAEWGPMPGTAGCRAPPQLLEPGDGEGWRELEKAA